MTQRLDILLHVDDGLYSTTDKELKDRKFRELRKEFEFTDEHTLSTYLGVHYNYDAEKGYAPRAVRIASAAHSRDCISISCSSRSFGRLAGTSRLTRLSIYARTKVTSCMRRENALLTCESLLVC